MISLTRLNNQQFVINSDLIETLEATPDTVVKLTTGKHYVVRDSVEEVMMKVLEFKRMCHAGPIIARQDKRDGP